MSELRVVAVAIRKPDGTIVSLPPPARHHHLIRVIYAEIEKTVDHDNYPQGFLLSDGTFATRKRALAVATAANQLIRRGLGCDDEMLFSENVW